MPWLQHGLPSSSQPRSRMESACILPPMPTINLGHLDAALQQVAALSADWAADTDQGYNGRKSQLWVFHPALQPHYEGLLFIQGQQVPTATTITHLGADVPAPHPARAGLVKQATRMQEVLAARWRLQQLPGYLALKAHVLAAKAMAKAAHAVAYFRPRQLEIKRFDTAMLGSVWTGGPTRAPEILYCLLLKGHQVSFLWQAPLAALAHHIRQLRRSTQYVEHWTLAWQLAHTPGKGKYGVLKAWLEALAQLGWQWEAPLLLRLGHADATVHLRDTPPAKIQHEGPEALRHQALRDLARRRSSSRGLEAGADRMATTAIFEHIEDIYLDGFLRNLLAGGVMWGTLRMTMGAVEHPDCVWCRSAPDTSEHLLAHCVATAPMWEWAGLTTAELLGLPPCVFHHGIMPSSGGGDLSKRCAQNGGIPKLFRLCSCFNSRCASVEHWLN